MNGQQQQHESQHANERRALLAEAELVPGERVEDLEGAKDRCLPAKAGQMGGRRADG
jgi:hypothetical protein